MSSLTIEEIKEFLFFNNVTLPQGRLKKDDYIQLYEQFSNGTNSDSQNSKNVSSSNDFDSQLVEQTVSSLSDDELYAQLQAVGCEPGPIVPSSRAVYEKKLLNIVRGNATNGNNSDNSDQKEKTPLRDVPAPREASLPPSADLTLSAPRRFTYIEKISRASNERIIERELFDGNSLRYREPHASGDYIGSWSPSASIKTQAEKKTGLNYRLIIIISVLMLVVAAILVYAIYPAPDRYQFIEEEAQKHSNIKSGY